MPINSDNQNKNQPQQNQVRDQKRPADDKALNRKEPNQFQSPQSDKRAR